MTEIAGLCRERQLGKDSTVPGLEKFRVGGWICQPYPITGRMEGCKENLVARVCFDMVMGTSVSPCLRLHKEEAIGHVSSSQKTREKMLYSNYLLIFP